jgi:hypothetical protein
MGWQQHLARDFLAGAQEASARCWFQKEGERLFSRELSVGSTPLASA